MSSVTARLLRVLSVLALGFSLLGIAIVPNPLTVSSSQSLLAPRKIPHTDVNPLGANFFLEREVEPWKKEHTLKMAKEAGIGWAKVHFVWESIEPKKGRFWDDRYKKSTWEKYDEIVNLCQRYGIRIIARLDRPPDWTRQDNSYTTAPPDVFDDYGDFVYAVVSRYKGRIQYYQIWNEPNIWPEWGNRPVDPKGYVDLLKVAYRRAKEADPNAIVLSAPLAQTLEKTPRNRSELDYLDAMYEAGAKDYFDILFANAYGFDSPPSDPPNPEVLNFSRVKLLREIMVRYDDANKAVWLNEFGWNASPEDFPKDKLYWRRVTEQQQADYTAEGIRLARSWDWVGVVNIWYFRQVGDILPKERSDYYFRVVDVDFTPRLVYYKLQELASSFKVALPGYHEETSPAVEASGSWVPLLRPSASGGTVFASSKPGDSLTFTFKGTDINLIFPGDISSGVLYVSVDGKNPAGLPRNGDGKAYVALSSPGGSPQARVSLVKGVSPGEHSVKITVAPGRADAAGLCAIDGFFVESSPSSLWPFYGFIGLFSLGVVMLLFSIRFRRPH